VIDPGGSNVTVVAAPGSMGSATLFGGTGSAFVSDGQGLFTGGDGPEVNGGFRNVMFSSTVAGSATLVGGTASLVGNQKGAPIDVLIARGQGQTLMAGLGNASLFGTADVGGTGGSTYIVGKGFSTVFGFGDGCNTFSFAGFGSSVVDGRDLASKGVQKANLFVDGDVAGGNYVIADFVSGLDVFQVYQDFTIEFTEAGDASNLIERTDLKIIGGATYTFFDASADGIAEIKISDVKLV